MRRHARVQPQEARLPVVHEVGAAFVDVGEGGTHRGRDDEVARVRVREAGVRLERVQGDDARVEEEGELEGAGALEEAHDVRAAVRRLVPGFEGAAFDEPEDVHAEFFEVLGEHELARRVRAGEALAVAGEDVDCLLG